MKRKISLFLISFFLFSFLAQTSFAQSEWTPSNDFEGKLVNEESYIVQDNIMYFSTYPLGNDTLFILNKDTKIITSLGVSVSYYNKIQSILNNTLYFIANTSDGQRVRSLDLLDKMIPHAEDIVLSIGGGSISSVQSFEKNGVTKLLLLGKFTSIETNSGVYTITNCASIDLSTGVVNAPHNPFMDLWTRTSRPMLRKNGNVVFQSNHDELFFVYNPQLDCIIEADQYFPDKSISRDIIEEPELIGQLNDERLVFSIKKSAKSGYENGSLAIQDTVNNTTHYYGEILSEMSSGYGFSVIGDYIYSTYDNFYQNNGDRVIGNYVTRLNLQTGLFEVVGSEFSHKPIKVYGDSILYVDVPDGNSWFVTYKFNTETGIWENSKAKKLGLYPNPISNGEVLHLSESVDNYTLYDKTGRAIKANKTETKTIDIQNLPVGIYNIVASKKEKEKTFTGRFIVK
ncbi:MAG: hypothetical protein ACI9AR_000095 [Flavobacteriaceae bacterium]|jgi:hypothetical protein